MPNADWNRCICGQLKPPNREICVVCERTYTKKRQPLTPEQQEWLDRQVAKHNHDNNPVKPAKSDNPF